MSLLAFAVYSFLLLGIASSFPVPDDCPTGFTHNGSACVECSKCEKGFEPLFQCTPVKDTSCRPCLPNTFSDVISATAPCQTCTPRHCDVEEGMFKLILRNCTPTSDTTCDRCGSGRFWGNVSCLFCDGPCAANQEEIKSCTFNTNRVCVTMPVPTSTTEDHSGSHVTAKPTISMQQPVEPSQPLPPETIQLPTHMIDPRHIVTVVNNKSDKEKLSTGAWVGIAVGAVVILIIVIAKFFQGGRAKAITQAWNSTIPIISSKYFRSGSSMSTRQPSEEIERCQSISCGLPQRELVYLEAKLVHTSAWFKEELCKHLVETDENNIPYSWKLLQVSGMSAQVLNKDVDTKEMTKQLMELFKCRGLIIKDLLGKLGEIGASGAIHFIEQLRIPDDGRQTTTAEQPTEDTEPESS